MMRTFQWIQARAKGFCHLCFPGFNWGLGLSYSSSGDAPVWALHGLQFLQDVSICSSPVLSRSHSVYVFFSPWNTFLSFFTDLEVHSAFLSLFFLHFSASWCFSGSSICFQSSDTSFSDAHCALFVGSFWSCLAAHLCLGFSHRDHPAALSLPTPCHINSCKSKQKQSITPQLAWMGEN